MSGQTATTAQRFTLDEEAAAETGFAERYPVEGARCAALAIDQAAHGDDEDAVITGPEGWTMYVDLLASPDGEIDAYRIGVRPPGTGYTLASVASDTIPWPEGSDTLDVLRWAVDTANQLVDDYAARTGLGGSEDGYRAAQQAHTHHYSGQTLRHAHEGGDLPHGYFGHLEDLPPVAGHLGMPQSPRCVVCGCGAGFRYHNPGGPYSHDFIPAAT